MGKQFGDQWERDLVYGIDEGNPLSEDQVYEINENAEGILHMKDKTDAFVYGALDINDWKVVSEISFDSFMNYICRTALCFILSLV